MTITDNHLFDHIARDGADVALLVVDAQPTFMPGGELPVPGGDNIIIPLVHFIRDHGKQLGLIAFSRDWHPADHFSFSERPTFSDGSWPSHGVAETPNAFVHPVLIAACEEAGVPYITISKGMDRDVEAYSSFDGINLENGLSLQAELERHHIVTVLVAGLAGEVCVQATALGGLERHFDVTLLPEAIGFLGDPEPAYELMTKAGARVAHLGEAA